MKVQISVMPAWIAGIQVRRMRPETSMSTWISALHAGMTPSRVLLKPIYVPSRRIFEGGAEYAEGRESVFVRCAPRPETKGAMSFRPQGEILLRSFTTSKFPHPYVNADKVQMRDEIS